LYRGTGFSNCFGAGGQVGGAKYGPGSGGGVGVNLKIFKGPSSKTVLLR